MCVYVTQSDKLTTEYSMQLDYLIRNPLPHTLWKTNEPESKERPPVVGIGNWGIIQYWKDNQAYWKWAKFAPARSQWRGGKPTPSYNTKAETLLAYIEGVKKSKYAKEVLEDVTERPCVFWVNSFFESNGDKNNPRWFHIYREDNNLIPLASYYREFEDTDNEEPWSGFTIMTRDPYELVEQTGHERSPGILAYSDIEEWLTPSEQLLDKVDLLADIPDGYYTIDEVERYSVTKRTQQATEPIEGGSEYLKGALEEMY